MKSASDASLVLSTVIGGFTSSRVEPRSAPRLSLGCRGGLCHEHHLSRVPGLLFDLMALLSLGWVVACRNSHIVCISWEAKVGKATLLQSKERPFSPLGLMVKSSPVKGWAAFAGRYCSRSGAGLLEHNVVWSGQIPNLSRPR